MVQKWRIFVTFLFGFITRAGDGFRSTLCVCAQICSYSNFADACSHIQILNQGNKSCRGHKPLTTKNFNNKNTPDGAFLLLNWLCSVCGSRTDYYMDLIAIGHEIQLFNAKLCVPNLC